MSTPRVSLTSGSCVTDFADYLELTVGQAGEQIRALAARRPGPQRWVGPFLPAGTLPVPGLRVHVLETLIGGNAQRLGADPAGS
jgi:hypothetical protein